MSTNSFTTAQVDVRYSDHVMTNISVVLSLHTSAHKPTLPCTRQSQCVKENKLILFHILQCYDFCMQVRLLENVLTQTGRYNKLLLYLIHVSLSTKLHMVRTMNTVNNINMITYRITSVLLIRKRLKSSSSASFIRYRTSAKHLPLNHSTVATIHSSPT